MADPFALNTDLSSAQWTPLVAIQLRLAGLGVSLQSLQKRVLLLGHKTSSGTVKLNSVTALSTQDQVNGLFGPTGEVTAQFAHLQAQLAAVSASGAEVYGIAIPEPTGGVQATHLITFLAQPTSAGLPGSNSAALTPHAVTAYIAGWSFPLGIAVGDTFAVLATGLAAVITQAIAAVTGPSNCPIESAIASGQTVTVKMSQRGAYGEDLPIRIEFSDPNGGVAASPGTLAIGGPSTASGAIVVGAGSLSTTTAVGSADAVATMCANVTEALRSAPNNLSAMNNNSVTPGQVVLLYQTGHVAHRIVASTTATGVTTTLAVGTAGSGVPDLTAALAAIQKLGAFRVWVFPWIDTATLSALSAHRAAQASGVIMKDQFLLYGDTRDEVTAGAVPLAPTPRLTTTPFAAGILCPDAEVRGVELAAHVAGTIVSKDTPAYNWDGEPLLTTGAVPLGAPHPDARLDPLTSANTAMVTYHLTPLVVSDASNQLVILRGVTTAQVASDELSNWSVAFCLAFARAFAVNRLRERFIDSHLMLKRVGQPQSPNTITDEAVADCIKEILDDLENGTGGSPPDVIDGADNLKTMVRAKSSKQNGGRIDALFPVRAPLPVHQIAVVEQQVL
jgi:phage tail sheath gpL-like